MINYSISMRRNVADPDAPKKAYAVAQSSRIIELDELAKMVAMQTTATRADVTAALIATVENMILALMRGEQIRLGDLGKFYITLSSKGANSAAEFSAANITGINIRFDPGKELTKELSAAEFNLVPSRKAIEELLREQKKTAATDEDEELENEDSTPEDVTTPDTGEGGDDFGV